MPKHKLSLDLLLSEKTAQTTLNEQTNRWEAALHQITEMAEEAIEQERTKTVEAEVNLNVFRLDLQESQEELQVWTDWYADLPEAETSEQREDLLEIPGASPLTPPVVQQLKLLLSHNEHRKSKTRVSVDVRRISTPAYPQRHPIIGMET